MALQQFIDFQNGIVLPEAFIEISSINLDYDREFCQFNVKTYFDKETKDTKNKAVTENENFHVSNTPALVTNIDGMSTPTTETVSLFKKYFSTGDIRRNAENYLLENVEKFKTAIQI